MNARLIATLKGEKALLLLEEHILMKSWVFYKMGFNHNNLSSAQIAAITECLLTSKTHTEAKKKVVPFLEKQLKKKEGKKEDRSKDLSWATTSVDPSGISSLGKILIDWINVEIYLKDIDPVEGTNQLVVLRRFWGNICGFYDYSKTFKEDMPLKENPS